MTPLAKAIVEQRCMPIKRRTIEDGGHLLTMMEDVHCFECSAAMELVDEVVVMSETRDGLYDNLGFLPCPKTWIEYVQHTTKGSIRYGWLLTQQYHPELRFEYAMVSSAVQWVGSRRINTYAARQAPLNASIDSSIFQYLTNENEKKRNRDPHHEDGCSWLVQAKKLFAMLAIINSPRIVNRRQHMPNSALERKMVATLDVQGTFPLHAWTEIKLEICAPKDLHDDASTEAHLTGKRALHFVRKFIRIRRGQLEYVRSHWRGDASLGIKQQRYALKDTGKPSDSAGLVATLEAIAEMPR